MSDDPAREQAWEAGYAAGYAAGHEDGSGATLERVVALLRTNGQTWTADWLEHGALDSAVDEPEEPRPEASA